MSEEDVTTTEKLKLNCETVFNNSIVRKIETADEASNRLSDDFETALRKMDQCIDIVTQNASSSGGGGGGGASSSNSGGGETGGIKGTDKDPVPQRYEDARSANTEQINSTEDAKLETENGSGDTKYTPPDIPDASNDDIVAKQLRELAESEADLELREKYWNQYRKYKGLKIPE